ncbi:hypothetical protein FXO38_23910 [Capsicum annuum]|nr:hypothetical protein FXO37_28031 [Capsicum annuum]KAF3637023.1 hypothetical protein FXO38_23910 [Capsicum annuum]
MMKNPHIMAKAESELRQVYTEQKIYDEENVETLTYLKLVVKEALRLHLPVPFIGPRECREKTNIKGYTIPFKTRVLVNAWTLARDPESWNNPERFIPQRFENSSVHFIGNHFEFISFGVGRRTCLVFLQLMCNRIAKALPELVSDTQAAFVKKRSLIHNVLMCHDILRHYNRKTSTRCLMMIDLQKAYDMIEWGFIVEMLEGYQFPTQFAQLVMTCVTFP